MAYDEDLADRIRAELGDEPAVSERAMFGGLAFLVAGNMAVAASGQGGLLVRAGTEQGARLVARTAAEPMEMRGRVMTGWLRVDAEHVRTTRQLARWVAIGVEQARTLPPKSASKRPPGRSRRAAAQR